VIFQSGVDFASHFGHHRLRQRRLVGIRHQLAVDVGQRHLEGTGQQPALFADHVFAVNAHARRIPEPETARWFAG